MKEKGERERAGGSHSNIVLPRLPDLDISKMQSSRWQKLAATPDVEFEAKVETAKKKMVAAVDGTTAAQMVQQTITNEHYTPSKYVEAARRHTSVFCALLTVPIIVPPQNGKWG